MNTADKVKLLNEYYEATQYYDDQKRIYSFDEDNINDLFYDPWEALRAGHFGNINLNYDYFIFNRDGNIEMLADWKIDELFEDSDFQEWIKENDHIESDED